jgi:hypothetical protein
MVQSTSDVDVDDAFNDERAEIEESRTISKCLMQILCDKKLNERLPCHTRHGMYSSLFDAAHVTFDAKTKIRKLDGCYAIKFDTIVNNELGNSLLAKTPLAIS